jgi:ketosteroid isomerase-like protein
MTEHAATSGIVHAEIVEHYRQWHKAFNEQDAATFVQFYSEDARLMPPGAEAIIGRNDLEQHLKEEFGAGIVSSKTRTVDLLDLGDVVIEAGEYETTVQPPSGEAFVDRGKYLEVFVRDPDGLLRVKFDIANSSTPRGTRDRLAARSAAAESDTH